MLSDGLSCFMSLPQAGVVHERHIGGGGKKSVQNKQFHWVNTVLGNLKTAMNATYHSIKHAKYADRYLAEFAYRFNQRFDLASMVPRLLHALATTKPHPLRVLRMSEAGH